MEIESKEVVVDAKKALWVCVGDCWLYIPFVDKNDK